jgi:O-acetyl-ADP-ribose deacetylase (regulator of RNase III)
MKSISYVRGDATAPQGDGVRIIAHVCNDRGGWGRGFVVAISRRWTDPEEQYRAWFAERAISDFALGAVQFVQVEDEIWVANMIGQHGMSASHSVPPIRYDAVETCLEAVAAKAAELQASVHMPRIGCGLAGGTWDRIEPIITKTLSERDIAVTVYDLPS